MRPLAKAVTKTIENVRNLLREQASIDVLDFIIDFKKFKWKKL